MEQNNNTFDDLNQAIAQGQSESTTKEQAVEFNKMVTAEHTESLLTDTLVRESINVGSDQYNRQLSVTGTYIELIDRMISYHTEQTAFMKEMLGKIESLKTTGDSFDYVPTEGTDKKPISLKNKIMEIKGSRGGKEVSGYEAKMLILAMNNNVKKCYLYNSGFHAILRSPTIGEMNLVYNRLVAELGRYGKVMGAIFFTYSDLKVKEILWDFIESLIIGTNLKNYKKLTDDGSSTTLRDNVSLHDYQPILIHIGSLIFKAGYPFVHACPDSKCKKIHEENVDIDMLNLTDFNRIPYEYLLKLATGDEIDFEEVQNYKANIKFKSKTVSIPGYKVYCRVPSITNYISRGVIFNEEMSMSLHDILSDEVVNEYLKYNYNQMFEPWVESIDILMEDKTVSFRVSGRDEIVLVLEQIQNEGSQWESFTKQMKDFIQESSTTTIGYSALPCPACGELPTNAVNGFVPFDAQNSFFTMLAMQLVQAS